MNYLEKLKAKISIPRVLPLLPKVKKPENEPTSHTALTAKSTLGTLDSTRGSCFFSFDELWQQANELADWIDDPGSAIPWQERVAKVPELQEMSLEIERLKFQLKGTFL